MDVRLLSVKEIAIGPFLLMSCCGVLQDRTSGHRKDFSAEPTSKTLQVSDPGKVPADPAFEEAQESMIYAAVEQLRWDTTAGEAIPQTEQVMPVAVEEVREEAEAGAQTETPVPVAVEEMAPLQCQPAAVPPVDVVQRPAQVRKTLQIQFENWRPA